MISSKPIYVLMALVAAVASPRAQAQVDPPGFAVALSDDALSRVRGGFAGNGLDISFGIERAVYISGALVASTSMTVSGGGAAAVIQNGGGNLAAISQTAAGTVIQNTLDGQKIQTVTTLNAAANSLGIYRNLNLGASMRGAVIDSLRR